MTVDHGRLSVDLREADIQTVLAQIAQQAGFALIAGHLDRKTISVQFADVELEKGLRRLLQIASLNYAMLYASGTENRIALTELQIFPSEGNGGIGSLALVAARNVEAAADDAQQRQEEAPPQTNVFQELLQRAQEQQQAQPPQEEAPTQTNPFQELLQRAQEQQQAQPPQEEAPTQTNPFQEHLQRQQYR